MPHKPSISIRRPTPNPAEVEDFIKGQPQKQEPTPMAVPLNVTPLPTQKTATSKEEGRSIIERADGRRRRRMTVYMPPELARQLRIHCVTEELEISELITAAVRRYLPAPPK